MDLAGLSPPTRGSRTGRAACRSDPGSIPAHTGKPKSRRRAPFGVAVYPRPHGEAAGKHHHRRDGEGLSPPTRGSLFRRGQGLGGERSIPAHTGKPWRRVPSTTPSTVYPRPHGEAVLARQRRDLVQGLSPPTRGSPPLLRLGRRRPRSIPAHTGKPTVSMHQATVPWVYPRPHGEADADAFHRLADEGLSPPTRGSPPPRGQLAAKPGSIPAHTGKPSSTGWTTSTARVYPRPHGEAEPARSRPAPGRGLSPPTRGSRRRRPRQSRCPRSIPAHTGKPVRRARPVRKSWVYPRPHGEAVPACHQLNVVAGLSPPTRGSRSGRSVHRGRLRSIPAHTGKPRLDGRRFRQVAVYPRPHGEAGLVAVDPLRDRGLSPPTRGSPLRRHRRGPPSRSIPAHTGKPTPSR